MKPCYILLTALVLLMICNKNSNSSDTQATVSAYLIDDPSPYDKVLIDVQSVGINDGTDNGPSPLRVMRPEVYNLLNFRNGRDAILASERLAKP